MHPSDEEHQGLLGGQNPQDPTKGGIQRFSSSSNWEEYNKKPATPENGPSKFDAIVILILLLMIGLSGFGLLKHYNVVIPDKPIEQGVRVAPATPHQKDSVVQEVFNKISSGLQNIGQEKVPDIKVANEADDLTIDSVLDNYLSKIEQYNDIQTEWVDDDDDVSKQIEEKLEEQQSIVEDLQDLIISQESEIQIIKPVFSKNIYTFRELQNGLRLLFIQSTSDGIQVTATLNMGTFNDPPEYPGLTELVFRCLQTNFLIEVYEHYTTLTAQLNLFEEINAKLQELHSILVKPVFLDINRNAQDLYDDLMQESKSGDLDYVSQFLNQQQNLKELSILQVEQDQLQQHYLSHISGDVLSIVFKSQEESETILNKIFASDLITLKNLHKYQEPYYENNYPEGKFVLKFRGDNDVLTVLTVGEEVSNQRFLSYLLPKPFGGAIYQNHLLITLDVDLSSVVAAINKFIQFLEFVKQSDEVQLQYLYSQMLATEELIFNTKYEENLTKIGQNLFRDPIYALKGEESLPIFDKEEFDLFVTELANNFIILVGSSGFQFDSTYVSQSNDSLFIQDAVINKLHQEFQYDLKPLVTELVKTEQQFSLPQISTFLPENLAIVSVCQEPVYKIQGFGDPIVDDLSKTVKEEKFDGLRDPQFETVEFNCEFPMPDFTKECQDKERAAQLSLAPYQIAKNVWWKPSKLGAMVFTGLFIEKPQSTLAQGKTLLKLLQKYYTELAKRQFQQEFLFGYELSFKETINGLSIQMLSYSEKQSEFQDKVFDLMATNDEQLFYYVKDLLNKDIRRFHDQKLSLLTQSYYLPKIMLRPVNTPQEILNVLDEVTYLTFEAFQKTLMASKIQIMNIGNILPQESVFEDSQEMYMTRTLNLKGQNLTYIVQRESNSDLTSAVLNYYQSGLRTIENAAKLHFYADFLQTYSNNYFSMGQQVLIKRKPLGCADGLQIYMQGEVPPKAYELIEQFLKQANLYLSNLQDEDLMESKLYTINKLYNEIKFKTLQEEGNFIWEKIVNKNYAFSEVQDVIVYLDEAFPQKLRECANLVMQGQVSVQVFGIQEDVVKSKDAILTVDELKGQDVYECFFTL